MLYGSSLVLIGAIDGRGTEAQGVGASDTELAEDSKGDPTDIRSDQSANKSADESNGLEREAEQPELRGLESRLRGITSTYPGEYGIVLWQPESDTRIEINAGESFPAASLAKLPALLALYKEASEERISLDEQMIVLPSDIQPGTGVLQNRPPGTAITLRECAEYLMQESDNTAWAMLERRLGKDRIRQELNSSGALSSRYVYAHNTTTPDDTLRLLRRVSDPTYTSPAYSQEMVSTMTGTAFEDRLPPGLPGDARISHKIGTLGSSFSDAGMVFPPEDERDSEPYYVVVLSRNTSEEAARNAMQEISLTAYRGLVDPEARPRSDLPVSGVRQEKARGE